MDQQWQQNIERRLVALETDKAVADERRQYMERRFNALEAELRKVEGMCDGIQKQLQNAVRWAFVLLSGVILTAFMNFVVQGGLNVGP